LGREDYRLVNASIEGSFVEDAYLYTGFLDILRESVPGSAQEKYLVIYTPGTGGTAPSARMRELSQLKGIIERKKGRELAESAFRELAEKGDIVIPNLQLKPSELKRLGLT
jgi:hypothetical protein